MKHHVGPFCPVIVNGEAVVIVRLGCLPRFTRKITICSDDTYRQFASKWHMKHHVQEAKQHTDKAFYLSLCSYCSDMLSDWGLMRIRVCFQKISKCYQKTVPCKIAFLQGRRYWGEQKVQLG